MKKSSFFLLFWSFLQIATGQLTIKVNQIPQNTPASDNIYVAGSFNNWDPGNSDYILSENNGIYTKTVNATPGTVEFKCTRGSWDTVEGNENGGFQPNHTFNYTGGAQTVELNILSWEDLGGGNTTAASNVQILDQDFFIPQLNRTRRIWLYLPPDYNTSTKHYPVMYMQDGQNLFDAYTSFSGEWEVDETLNDIFLAGDYGCIVVGIDNGGSHRIDEYSPWVNPQYGGGEGEAYADFLANTLKPYIDDHYRTMPGREFTGVAGSSMGAIISMYTAIEYQEIFGKVGIFSPAFWFSDSLYQYTENVNKTYDLRTYFVAGAFESSGMVQDMTDMYYTLVDENYNAAELFLISHADGEHSEWFWAREFPNVYDWLFGDVIISIPTGANKPSFYIYPNPSDSMVFVSPATTGYSLAFYTTNGKKVLEQKISSTGQMDISPLQSGMYYLVVRDERQNMVHINKFIKS